jgi:cellulose synthase/poly-beta-1,6-N-acetylglucosamine synthase-like glycosyltransferase
MLYLFAFSINQFLLTLSYRKKKDSQDGHASLLQYPTVTIQLPIYNESKVTQRLLEAVDRLDYPIDKLEVQVLDDSTDETSDIVREFIEGREKSYVHIRRNKRSGFKAGALQQSLSRANGEYVALFDADFLPESDFLLKTLPFFADKDIAMVQVRWDYLNKSYSLLTELQAFGLNAHFSVEQTGRSQAGVFMNFNGTAGVWRKEAIIDSGGWSADTLTEDLDLSFRSQLKGWKFRYLEDYSCPSELPISIESVKKQQYRWTKGTAETARKLLGTTLKSNVSRKTKVSSFFHLTSSFVFLSIFLSSVISVPLLYLKPSYPQLDSVFIAANLFVLGFILITYFYWKSYSITSREKLSFAWKFPMFMGLTMSLGLNNSLAVVEGIIGKKSAFIRTPKYNISNKGTSQNPTFQSRITFINILEGVLALYFAAAIYLGYPLEHYGLIAFHLFLFFGYGLTTWTSIKEYLNAR